jgi:tRNA threonylcarbamoyladenosine biosynthesis protein TsaB
MLILGTDTSTASLTVSLINEKKILADYSSLATLKHSAILIPTIQKALKKINAKIGDIDLFSLGIGPGSFTGLRVGITTIRALAIALDKPIVGVPTLDVIAHNGLKYLKRKKLLGKITRICPILDAKKRQVYACIYRYDGDKIIKESDYLLEPVEILVKGLKGSILFLGDAIPLYKEQLLHKNTFKANFLDDKSWLPRASVIARMALAEYERGKRDNPYDLVPLYLYPSDCNVRYDR